MFTIIHNYKLTFVTILFSFSAYAQNFTPENFEQEILQYEPVQKDHVSEKDFNRGVFYLDQTKAAVENKPENLNVADYWNITMAFIALGESQRHIEMVFQKAIENDHQSVCKYLKATKADLKDIVPQGYAYVTKLCISDSEIPQELEIETYIKKLSLSPSLTRLVHQISLNDQKHRLHSLEKQKAFDKKNQQLIDSLFEKYQTYIGRSLVGTELEATMWAVVQHSNLKYMEKYLPIIHKAVQKNELAKVPLKMLLDRIYTIKYGYQIYGSQQGVMIAKEAVREKVQQQYALK